MGIIDKVKKALFTEAETEKPAEVPTLESIRTRLFEANRNLEMRNREAAAAEARAQAALQKTFQAGMSTLERQKLIAESQKAKKEAAFHLRCAGQFIALTETLENAETLLELSDTIKRSGLMEEGALNLQELMKELENADAFLEPLMGTCQEIRSSIEASMGQFDGLVSQGVSEETKELEALYRQFEMETDPEKKEAIRQKIETKMSLQAV
ncbi:MAG: hypothetical protein IKQ55_01965 [Kiritimatiellae bacterium]|nr:hypothetical protein [Kiritimatiellia bacterium]